MLMLASPAFSQINLVYDFVSGATGGSPVYITPYNSNLYMAADDGTHGYELWKYSGTGTPTMVTDFNPGAGAGFPVTYNQTGVVVNNILYLPANNGTTGIELYKYDGTSITLAADIYPGATGSNPLYLTLLNGKIYFTATTSDYGNELHVYDPATSAETRLTDINPVAASSTPFQPVVFNGKLYFLATEPTFGTELYSYDPATNNTAKVADLNTGALNSFPIIMANLSGKLYFSATTATSGRELYSYDGTSTPVKLTDLSVGATDGIMYAANSAALYNGKIFFPGSTNGSNFQLYQYDPASNTASLVYTLNGTGNSSVNTMTVYLNKLYFSGTDGTHGSELWVYDGTNTSMLMDLNPGAGGSNITDLTSWNNQLYMNGTNGSTGYELYRYSDLSGVRNVSFDGSVKVYPNPADGDVQMQITSTKTELVNVLVTDMAGREVYRSSANVVSNNATILDIPMAAKPAGVYFYSVLNANGKIYTAGKLVRK